MWFGALLLAVWQLLSLRAQRRDLCGARGQYKRKHRPLSHFRAYVETQTEQLDETLDDAQSQAITITRAVGGDPYLVELVINVGDLICRNADSGVQHLD